MDGQLGKEAVAVDPRIQVACDFLSALFDPTDYFLIRPIETWTQDGKKQSRVHYELANTLKATPRVIDFEIQKLIERSESDHFNVFFGVCPRFGGGGKYDLAWQIRSVRCLWADIDHVTPTEAETRVARSGLPTPSIAVNSGNGMHLYWLLDTPLQIDDVGDPPPVESEWKVLPSGRKSRRQFVLQDGGKIYLDKRSHISELSAKAMLVQDTLAGIAKPIGGDHTHDLARLLRIPGTMNRKNERNGVAPIPTELLSCDVSKKYAFADFERFRIECAETKRTRQISSMPLPKPRRVSASKVDKLAELIAVCSIAEPGQRSEADFSVCCYAVRNGIAKNEVWESVSSVGKFAEQGQRYFDVTWGNAEQEVKSSLYNDLSQNHGSGKNIPNDNGAIEHDFDSSVVSGSALEGSSLSPRPATIVVDTTETPISETLQSVTECLVKAGNCYLRSNQLVVIHKEEIATVLSPPELAGLLNEHVEFFFVGEKSSEYRPFPTTYANTWLHQRVVQARLPEIKLFTRHPVYTQDWRLISSGFDMESGIYCAGATVDSRTERTHLNALLADFCFRTAADRTNFIGMLLTAILVPRFIGCKPAVLFNGNQPGLGKSILAQMIATLRDGSPAETVSYNPNDEELEKRLGAVVRRGATTIILDNAKCRGRNSSIDSACLERSITDPILSFRLLGQSASIRAENSHLFCITANSPEVSRDLITRSVVVNLYHEGDPKRRKFQIEDPEGYALDHRQELLGELIGMVEYWKSLGMPPANVQSRFNKRGWAKIVGGILEACGEPDFLANADEVASTLDEGHLEFSELVEALAQHPQGIWTSSELVEFCRNRKLLTFGLGEGTPRSQSTKFGTLASRFQSESFILDDVRTATFHKTTGRKGSLYQVLVHEKVPDLGQIAEPMPDLQLPQGTAP